MQVKGRLVYSTNRTTSVKETGAAKLLHLIAPVFIIATYSPVCNPEHNQHKQCYP